MDANELGRWTRFAAKGGIGKCTAAQDCVAEADDDLMFLKVRLIFLLQMRTLPYSRPFAPRHCPPAIPQDDEITVLMQLPGNDDLYLVSPLPTSALPYSQIDMSTGLLRGRRRSFPRILRPLPGSSQETHHDQTLIHSPRLPPILLAQHRNPWRTRVYASTTFAIFAGCIIHFTIHSVASQAYDFQCDEPLCGAGI